MKTRFSSREIAHVWAHQQAPRGKSPGNASFIGKVFYSYGTAIGELIEVNGQQIVIVNETSYSNSTSEVQSRMRGAISHLPEIRVYGVRMGTSNLTPYNFESKRVQKKWARERIRDSLDRAAKQSALAQRARSNKDYRTSEMLGWIEQANFIAKTFGLPPLNVDITSLTEKHKKAIENENRRERERQKKLEREKAEQIQKWVAGEPDAYFPMNVDRVYLRVNRNLQNEDKTPLVLIETSRGVSFPYDDGKRAFMFCMKMREKGWRRNGEQFQIGSYQLDSIGPDGIIAGCHRVSWATIEEFAKKEGWM